MALDPGTVILAGCSGYTYQFQGDKMVLESSWQDAVDKMSAQDLQLFRNTLGPLLTMVENAMEDRNMLLRYTQRQVSGNGG